MSKDVKLHESYEPLVRSGRPTVPGTILLAMLALAGCVDPSAPAAGEENVAREVPATRIPLLGAAVAALEGCASGCFEPSVALDGAGRVFVTTVAGEAIARSDDGGSTFTRLASPPAVAPSIAVPGASATTSLDRSDALVSVDPRGRLYYTTLTGGFQGVQLARSDDGGDSWALNRFVSLLAGDVVPAAGLVDRQWVGFKADGTVYLSYSQVPSGIWVLRSADGGASFEPAVRAVPMEGRANLGQAGPPVVDASGRVALPYLATVPGASARVLRVAVSEDEGKSFASHDVGIEGDYFPIASFDAAGRLAVVVVGPEARRDITLGLSLDGGRTWGAPIVLSEGARAAGASPWLTLQDGVATVLWYGDAGNGRATLEAARADLASANPAIVRARLAEGIPVGGDFAAMASVPGTDRAVVAWVGEREALVAVERAPPAR